MVYTANGASSSRRLWIKVTPDLQAAVAKPTKTSFCLEKNTNLVNKKTTVTFGLVSDKSCLKDCASHRKEVTITGNLLEKKFIFSSWPISFKHSSEGRSRTY